MSKILTRDFKFILAIIFLYAFSLNVEAQNKPFWIESSWRVSNYENTVFLTGFSQDTKKNNETIGDLTQRVKQSASADLGKSVISTIKSTTNSYFESILKNGNESISEDLTLNAQIESNIEINGVTVDTYFDKESNIGYAFAYVNKYEVIGYYKALINLKIQKANDIIEIAQKLENDSEKIKAIAEYKKFMPVFEEISFAQGLLIAIDKNSNTQSLQTELTSKLFNTVADALQRLSNGIKAYIDINEDLFGVQVNIIEASVKSFLSKQDFNFTDSLSGADWHIKIDVKPRKHNISHGIFFCYLDVNISLIKISNNKKIYEEEITEKGGHSTSYIEAAREASKEIAPKIADKIIKALE